MVELIFIRCEELISFYNKPESLFVKMSLNDEFSFLFCLPSRSINAFADYLNNLFIANNFVLRNKCIFIGDFNVDYLKIDEFLSYRHLFDIMSERGIRQLIDKPTRLSSTTGLAESLLDHIWVNFERDMLTEVVNYPLSDHLPIVLILKLEARKYFVKKSFRELGKENFKRYDREVSII